MDTMPNQVHELQYALDTFYFLMTGALVMWMAAGFAMLEAGLVRAKNTTEILTKNVALFAVACTMYMLCGYQIMYDGGFLLLDLALDGATSPDALEGSVHAEFSGKSGNAYSNASDFFFQAVFVATCMSIVSGAVAERMKLWSFLVFAIVMTGFIYPMQGSWVWAENLVFGLYDLHDYKDYAGSGVVHLAGASAALAGVLMLGARKGKFGRHGEINAIPGANLPLATLGTMILWMGWFGFNGGSELAIDSIKSANNVAMVFVNTNVAACGGLMAALATARLMFGKADLTMTLNGALAGLVAITAGPVEPTPLQACLIGIAAGVLVVMSILMLERLKIDDPVGAISVHGTAGLWGILAVPITDSEASFLGQLGGALTIFAWVFLASLLVWIIIKAVMGIRVTEEEEFEGVDITECGMEAYPEFTRD